MDDSRRCGPAAKGPDGWVMPSEQEPFEIVLGQSVTCPVCGDRTVTWWLADGRLSHRRFV